MPPKEIHEDFMETLGKESPSISSVKKWAAEFKRGREHVEDDGRSDATTDENIMVVHSLVMCDRRLDLRSTASEMDMFWGSTINPNRHLRYVKGFGKMGAANVDR